MGDLRAILKSTSGPGLPNEADQPASHADAGQQRTGMTSIYVTHDQEEAFAIADRVLVMNAGRIEQQGLPFDLYRHPQNAFVARFLGMDNLVQARIIGRDPLSVHTPIGEFQLDQHQLLEADDVQLLIRPEAGIIELTQADGPNTIEGKLENISFRGRHRIVTLMVPTSKGQVILKFTFDTNIILPTDQSVISIRLKRSELMLVRT
jgi:ABC-type Fe3+/spermidine/putrescine transport system ATPase subunit